MHGVRIAAGHSLVRDLDLKSRVAAALSPLRVAALQCTFAEHRNS